MAQLDQSTPLGIVAEIQGIFTQDPQSVARQAAYDASFRDAQDAGTVPHYPMMDQGGWDPYLTKLNELLNPGGEIQLPGVNPVDGTITLPDIKG